MCRKFLSGIATAIIIGFTPAFVVADAQAGGVQSAERASATKIEGIISTVELDGTIVVKPASGSATIIYARENTKISRNGKPAQIRDLRVGDKLWASYVPESRSAVEMRATGPS